MSQNPLSSPTTGTVSGLNLTNNYNSALDSVNTMNSGSSAPANQLSASPSAGNLWLDNASNPYPVNVYDGADWVSVGWLDATNHDWVPALPLQAQGNNAPLNLAMSASVSSNALTVTVGAAGAGGPVTPTTANVVSAVFNDFTAGGGEPELLQLTAGTNLSMTVASGNTLGAPGGNVPFRVWVVLLNFNGTPGIGLVCCTDLVLSSGVVITAAVYPIDETTNYTTPGGTSGGDDAGIIYSNVSDTVGTPKILGYLEWDSGLATAGAWASAPSKIVLHGPGGRKPGDVVQRFFNAVTTVTTTSGTSQTRTALGAPILMSSAANLVRVAADGTVGSTTSNDTTVAQLSRGTGPTLFGSVASVQGPVSGSVDLVAPAHLLGYDAPQTTSLTIYYVYVMSSGSGTGKWNDGALGTPTSTITLEEIMT